MPKIASKFTAEFTIKLGKALVSVKLPVDLESAARDGSFDELSTALDERATEALQDMIASGTLKNPNKADLKRAFKAYVKANPPEIRTS